MGLLDNLRFWKHRERTPPPSPLPESATDIPPPGGAEPTPLPRGPEPVPSLGEGIREADFGRPEPSFGVRPPGSALGGPALDIKPPGPAAGPEREFQVINAKLDTLHAQLDLVIQRIEALERRGPPESATGRAEPWRWR